MPLALWFHPHLEAADSLDATVVNMRFVKPLDESLILDIARSHDMLITVEENTVLGGAGSGVSEILRRQAIHRTDAESGPA